MLYARNAQNLGAVGVVSLGSRAVSVPKRGRDRRFAGGGGAPCRIAAIGAMAVDLADFGFELDLGDFLRKREVLLKTEQR